MEQNCENCKNECSHNFKNLSKSFESKLLNEIPKKHFRGAGVIILNKLGTRILLVLGKTHNKWSFPKGSKENNESIRECALRELEEETGITKDKIKLTNQYFIDKEYLYFIGNLNNEKVKLEIKDKREIKKVEWKSIKSISTKERKQCNTSLKAILPKALVPRENKYLCNFSLYKPEVRKMDYKSVLIQDAKFKEKNIGKTQ